MRFLQLFSRLIIAQSGLSEKSRWPVLMKFRKYMIYISSKSSDYWEQLICHASDYTNIQKVESKAAWAESAKMMWAGQVWGWQLIGTPFGKLFAASTGSNIIMSILFWIDWCKYIFLVTFHLKELLALIEIYIGTHIKDISHFKYGVHNHDKDRGRNLLDLLLRLITFLGKVH